MESTRNKVTALELYEEVFKDYDSSREKNRIYKIFDQESEFNKRLNKFGELVKHYVPDMEEELNKLGFGHHVVNRYSSFVTPDHIDCYFNDEGDIIEFMEYGNLLIAGFNGLKKTFQSKYLGENEREFLRWLKCQI